MPRARDERAPRRLSHTEVVNDDTTVGPYQLLAPIAQGGMGMVFRAWDPRAEREVALKVLLASGSPAGQQRLLREARALAKLRHPNVVQVHDAGESPRGPYLALELIPDSRSLAERLVEQGPLQPADAAQIVAELADALQACHDAGVLHRDVKPGNVLLALDGRPVLTDFGLALQATDSLTRLSRTGAILGTPGFFSPEQAHGRLGEIDERSDVYGLGATLYALLTGHAPVEGATLAEVVIATANRRPRPPSDSSPDVDPHLDRIVLRCLEREPAKRYRSAAELATALRAYGRGERPASPRRGPLLLTGLLLVLATAGAVAVGSRDAPSPAVTTKPTGPSSSPTPSSRPHVAFTPPPEGTSARVRCRFEQSFRHRGVNQILAFEFRSLGTVRSEDGEPVIHATISRVKGRVSDRVNDLRFDSGNQDRMTGTAKLVAGDLLALVGKPLTLGFAHGPQGIRFQGLPSTVKVAGLNVDPPALAKRRLQAACSCLPIPEQGAEWRKTIPFAIRAAYSLHTGETPIRCRLQRSANAVDVHFEAAGGDATLSPDTPPITGLTLTGRMTMEQGFITSCQVNVAFKGQFKGSAYAFACKSTYKLELPR